MPIRDSITIDDALVVLNRAYEADPEAMAQLVQNRVACNDKLGTDKEIQTRQETVPGAIHDTFVGEEVVEVGDRRLYSVGLVGILNGLFGRDDRTGFGRLAVNFDLGCPNCSPSREELKKSKGLCPVCNRRLKPIKFKGFEKVDPSRLPDRS